MGNIKDSGMKNVSIGIRNVEIFKKAEEKIVEEGENFALLSKETNYVCSPGCVEDEVVGMRCHQEKLPDFF